MQSVRPTQSRDTRLWVNVRPSPANVSRFFKLGLELMDGDVGGAQEVIKLFASEAGLAFIKNVTDRNIAAVLGDAPSAGFWEAQIKPLFQLITHPAVVDCAVLEQQVAMLFNFIVFGYVAALVKAWPTSAPTPPRIAAVELTLAVLTKILDSNTTNIINDKFSTLANSLSTCLEEEVFPDEEFSRLQALKYLEYIRLRLSLGEDIANVRDRPQAAVAREQFLLRRDLPGQLSADGTRHDNDHAEIPDIKILPTYEEIMSPRAEYLPTIDPSQWHVKGIRGRLDREFRLLREDTVGQLRDAIRVTLESIRNPQAGPVYRSKNVARTDTYEHPKPVRVDIDRFGNMELVTRCSQIAAVRALTLNKRREWWMQSKKLQAGALVCILNAGGSVIFCVVSESTMRTVDDKKPESDGEVGQKAEDFTLSENQDVLYVRLQLIDPTSHDITQTLCWYRNVGSSPRHYLVEFPGVLLASKPSMPFSELLAPGEGQSTKPKINPPQYARRAGFSFDLACLTQPGIKLSVSPQNPPDPEEIASRTTLDPTQEFSLIQEKIIKVLLGNKDKAKLGPILCLLEHLLDDRITEVIRIGSRSKSERLQDLNLRAVAKLFGRTKSEKAGLTRRLIRQLSGSDFWRTVKTFLAEIFPTYHRELFGMDERIVEKWLNAGATTPAHPRTPEALNRRRSTYDQWLRAIRDPIITQIISSHREYAEMIDERDQANIVGVTTTGLARNLGLLRKLRCKVLLCEEAGEVLEAHILTALLPSVEQAILIGDHLQLRPQIQNYDLQSSNPRGEQYSLDMSLFERLVEPPHMSDSRLPFSVLETQRRMHPSIAELVSTYPEVVGMRKRLFCHDPLSTSHSNEFEIEMTTALVSHLVRQGEYSKEDIARLRRRMESMFEICLNDRDQEEVEAVEAVEGVTQPSAQVAKTTLLKSIRIATVDNFQGEEAKVIIICLVRSNPQNNCGFLRTSNRINVLLSRAQHGMYIIGNANTYSSIPMWADVIRTLQADGNFGTSLELQCPRHLDTPLAVSEPDHFVQFAPESGCNLPCDKRLDCGHSCNGRCHSEILHNAVKCLEDCPRSKKGCNHPCPLRCGDVCHQKCQKLLGNICLTLPCGHYVSSAKCWEVQDPASIRCKVVVTRTVLGCGHAVKVQCHENCGHLRPCGHKCTRLCNDCRPRKDGEITASNHGACSTKCGRNYTACRHTCGKVCHDGDCAPCAEPCEVKCGHSKCAKRCHEPCSPCAEQTCHSSCPHTKCTMPCAAPCNWVPCSKRCSKVLICGHQCPSVCGESCPSKEYCQNCASTEIKSTTVDFLEMREYHEIDLDEEPCIFPDCGHFLTIQSMDGQMDIGTHYDLDESGIPIKIRGVSEPFSTDSALVRVCPNCRGSLRNISRYGRIVRRGMLDEATKRFIGWSNTKYLSLADRLVTEQGKLQKTATSKDRISASAAKRQTPKKQTFTLPRLGNLHQFQLIAGDNGRYASMMKVWAEISSFASMVQEAEQPFQRVADLVKHANRLNRTNEEFQFDESVIQVKGHLLAMTLLLKCDVAVFSDFFHLQSEGMLLTSQRPEIDWSIYTTESAKLIEAARANMFPREEVQGHIFAAQMSTFERCTRSQPTAVWDEAEEESDMEAAVRLKDVATDHLNQARALLQKYPSTAVLRQEIESAEIMLNDWVFYSEVTEDEKRAIYHAMSSEFRGTGHWYTCVNGHPFTVGECGMPMEQARCSECGAAVGGQNHAPAEGVRHANEIEALARGVGGLGL
ncbi:hypothetical protein B0T26DRAFT_811960 [Lasiosphaeria miniovina]|uniref:RZ-type domain-containing protein n=1 Tax=Lasiosphaeria miniovina TaxID=1954250 RepID=A0AA40DX33_9PEZI|nr:uncharacterized protein B0T26DRAFT_811960 [Lasiosphaeria miniovina]KAK0716812.1 hypothetical protein B0T26DRAFT_811960 [Lasiosphaeria miniovina]